MVGNYQNQSVSKELCKNRLILLLDGVEGLGLHPGDNGYMKGEIEVIVVIGVAEYRGDNCGWKKEDAEVIIVNRRIGSANVITVDRRKGILG